MRPETIFVLSFVIFLVTIILLGATFMHDSVWILMIVPLYIIVDYFIHKDNI